ncbi:MAG: hypothetical protein KGK08_12315 [Acidobacteriota bacterium]|nr:hypothetical protein [Acidobacteriota bacterium]
MATAAQWPVATAEVNHWKLLEAPEEIASFATPSQIEAAFHFVLDGEYYGGYLRSEPLSRADAKRFADGAPRLQVRYNPAHPDTNVVLNEDNHDNQASGEAGGLGFRVLPGA